MLRAAPSQQSARKPGSQFYLQKELDSANKKNELESGFAQNLQVTLGFHSL
jgi:hypothetical protein